MAALIAKIRLLALAGMSAAWRKSHNDCEHPTLELDDIGDLRCSVCARDFSA